MHCQLAGLQNRSELSTAAKIIVGAVVAVIATRTSAKSLSPGNFLKKALLSVPVASFAWIESLEPIAYRRLVMPWQSSPRPPAPRLVGPAFGNLCFARRPRRVRHRPFADELRLGDERLTEFGRRRALQQIRRPALAWLEPKNQTRNFMKQKRLSNYLLCLGLVVSVPLPGGAAEPQHGAKTTRPNGIGRREMARSRWTGRFAWPWTTTRNSRRATRQGGGRRTLGGSPRVAEPGTRGFL